MGIFAIYKFVWKTVTVQPILKHLSNTLRLHNYDILKVIYPRVIVFNICE